MFRALSCRRNWSSYERLEDELSLLEVKLKRDRSLPARAFTLKNITNIEPQNDNVQVKQKKKKKASILDHPLFSLFDGRAKKKPSSRPEFARYLEYIKEGGTWDLKSSMPIIYYK